VEPEEYVVAHAPREKHRLRRRHCRVLGRRRRAGEWCEAPCERREQQALALASPAHYTDQRAARDLRCRRALR